MFFRKLFTTARRPLTRRRGQLDCPLWVGGQRTTQSFTNGVVGGVIARRKIIGSGTLSSQKWLPVVVETREPGDNVERANLHLLYASTVKKLAQRFGIAERETPGLIVCQRSAVDSRGRIPELT
jgi:hypothetical protein